MTKIKKIITAMQNPQINEELKKDPQIQVIGPDHLYQEAVLETIKTNEDIDYLILNENLPGEKIENFLEKIPQIKTIIFTEKSTKTNKIKGAYKQYQNAEITIDQLKQIITQTTYTQDLEQEIQNLKKQLQEKQTKPKKFKLPSIKLPKLKPKNKKIKIEIILKIENKKRE